MKTKWELIIVFFIILCVERNTAFAAPKPARDSLLIMFWNIENFFDYKDEGKSSADKEFSSLGERRWTKKRFYTKCDAIAKSILWIGDKYGRMPDIIAWAEIENKFVLQRLRYSTILHKLDYKIVHYDSPDPRGIDVALFYRESIFDYISSKAIKVDTLGMKTRDILLVKLKRHIDDKQYCYSFLVNHHPSKYGGGKSEWRRKIAIDKLNYVCLAQMRDSVDYVISMGDFNDVPSKVNLSGQVNLAARLAEKGLGTIRFRGKWQLIDMFLMPEEQLNEKLEVKMGIVNIPFLQIWDNVYAGYKPFRTYLGPRYIGGVSDHCPIILHLYQK